MKLGLAALALLAAACSASTPCATSDDCGVNGVCLPTANGATHYCGSVDASCPSGLRWSSSAGGGLASSCVSFSQPDGPAAIDAPLADGPTADAPGSCGPEGSVCMPTADPCKQPGRCTAGVCTPITNAADGTSCGAASDACHTAPVCKGGTCQPQGTRPDGYNYQSGNYLARCCGGHQVSINTGQNCGACGISCEGGSCVNAGATNAEQWWCTCSANSQCWSGCCAGGSPNVCSPSTCVAPAQCITCPGNATCEADQDPHYWCHY